MQHLNNKIHIRHQRNTNTNKRHKTKQTQTIQIIYRKHTIILMLQTNDTNTHKTQTISNTPKQNTHQQHINKHMFIFNKTNQKQ